MTYYDEQLRILGQQVARKVHLEKLLRDLKKQKETLEAKVADLEHIKMDEEKDVDRLEGRGLISLFYDVIGKKGEKLDKELSELYAATAKYKASVCELKAVDDNIAKHEAELRSLSNCEKEYSRILEEKGEAIKKLGGVYAQEILDIEEQLSQLDNKKQEINEATAAGKVALQKAEAVSQKLDEAHSWALRDLGGGGLISSLAKHSALDEAQRLIEELQAQLRRFKTELADVTVHADVHAIMDESLRFADCFFDNFFADFSVLEKIEQSQEQINSTIRQIHGALDKLVDMRKKMQNEQTAKYAALDDLIIKTKI